MRKLAAWAALAAFAALGLAVAQRTETRDEQATRCASVAALGRGVAMIGVPTSEPDGYRDGRLVTHGCAYIAADGGRDHG